MYDEYECDEQSLPAELSAIERRLTGLTPAAPRVDRDRLMFAAGRASAVPGYSRPGWPGYIVGPSWAGSRIWPAATVLATAASVMLATMLVWQRAETDSTAERPVADVTQIKPMPAKQHEWRWSDRIPSGYLGVRHVALTQGVGALDRAYPAFSGDADEPAPPITARQLLEELLPKLTHTSS